MSRTSKIRRRHFSKNGRVRDAAYDFEAWEREVRDPADYRSEGPRRIAIGSCSCEYELAPLPDGRWAMQADYHTGHSGGGHGWRAYETRQAALNAFLWHSLRYFDMKRSGGCVTKADLASAPKMLERLHPTTLFGFDEPELVPREKWYPEMIADRVGSMTMHRNWDLIGVIRGGDYRPVSPAKDGSFFAIPVPWDKKKPKNKFNDDEDFEPVDDEDEEDDEM